MVCQFLLYNKVNQLYIYICPHISSLLHLPPLDILNLIIFLIKFGPKESGVFLR